MSTPVTLVKRWIWKQAERATPRIVSEDEIARYIEKRWPNLTFEQREKSL